MVVVFTWAFALAFKQPESFDVPSSKTWLFLVLSGLATGLSWLCYFRALQLGPASRVAPIDKLSVALVIVFGTLILGEKLTAGKTVGGLLIVAGAIVIALSRANATATRLLISARTRNNCQIRPRKAPAALKQVCRQH